MNSAQSSVRLIINVGDDSLCDVIESSGMDIVDDILIQNYVPLPDSSFKLLGHIITTKQRHLDVSGPAKSWV
jgi:hypothetical protein